MSSDYEKMKKKVKYAINQLISNDSYLLENDANEVTLSSTLFCYLKNQFNGYDVDCEYNRRQNGDPKKLNVSRESCIQNTFVKPDIIVHQRDSTDHNYLVIEVKKTKSSKKEINFDDKKLRKFTIDSNNEYLPHNYGYSYGLGLIFKSGKNCLDDPILKWFNNGEVIEEENL